MNKEKQRIAIAEACGWRHWDLSPQQDRAWMTPSGATANIQDMPDYLNDLNAIHEAEKDVLKTVGQWIEYVEALAKVCLINATAWEMAVQYHDRDMQAVFYKMGSLVKATAAQRCEAFLKTIHKWEETIAAERAELVPKTLPGGCETKGGV